MFAGPHQLIPWGFGKYRLEYLLLGISLTSEMHIRSVIALFMGLVIQLSQVQASCMAFDSAKSCGVEAQAMSCCDGLQSCPCVGRRRFQSDTHSADSGSG